MTEAVASPHQPKRPRSPSYPGISLPQAIERAKKLYQAENRNAAPIDAILQHWAYSPGSGAGMVAVAALKKFGLLADEGSGKQRKARLTNLALKIILDERENSPERDEAIKLAALSPSIHKEVWEKFSGLPSDATLRHFLRFERGFTNGAADELVKEIHETVSFAKLDQSDTLSNGDGDTGDASPAADDGEQGDGFVSAALLEEPRTPETPDAPPPIQLRVQGRTVMLRESQPLTGAEWDKMIEILKMLRPDDD